MLSLYHLKYFCDAATLGGIGPAAQRNRVSPSAVSQAIKSLEVHFDCELLEHAKNRFVLTPEGKALLENSQSVFSATEALEEHMRPSTGQPKGEVLFATQQSIANYILPGFLAEFRDEYPEVKPHLRIGTTDVVKTWLEQRTVEFGLNVDNFGEHDFFSMPIYTGKYVFVEAKDPKRRKRREQPFILPGAYTRETKSFKSDYLKKYKKSPEIALEVKSWTIVKKMAEVGMGIGLLPDFIFRFDSFHAVRLVEVELPTIPYSICANYPNRRQKLSRQSQVFLESFKKYIEKIANK